MRQQIVPTFLKELIYKVRGLQVLLQELDRFGILLGEREGGQREITVTGSDYFQWLAYCFWQSWHNGPPLLQELAPYSLTASYIPVILWLVIIVVVVGIGVTVVVIVAVVVVVVVECWAYAFHQDKASSVRVPVANVTLFSSVHLLQTNLFQSVQPAGVPSSPRVPVGVTGVPGHCCSYVLLEQISDTVSNFVSFGT
ncbi:hypothetical protein Tco_1192713 [Tanacetum coccineum]